MDYKTRIELLTDLWKAENAVKTNKLIGFFIVQSILVTAFFSASGNHWAVPSIGIAFSFLWYFCIGRTVAYQKQWALKIQATLKAMPEEHRDTFDVFPTSVEKLTIPLYGKMPSTYILLWPPVAGVLLWIIILTYVLVAQPSGPVS